MITIRHGWKTDIWMALDANYLGFRKPKQHGVRENDLIGILEPPWVLSGKTTKTTKHSVKNSMRTDLGV
jgi:hypothetical protein